MTLYDLSQSIRDVIDCADEAGELTDELLVRLDALTPMLDEKVNAYCVLIREARSRNTARQAEIDRLKAAMSTDGNLEDRLKARLHTSLEIANARNYQTQLFKVWLQTSPPAAKCLVPPDELPTALQRIKIEPNNVAALEEWKATGKAPDGFQVTQGEHLRIR